MSKKKKKTEKTKKADIKPVAETKAVLAETPSSAWPIENGIFTRFDNLRKEIDHAFNQFSDRFGLFPAASDLPSQVPIWDVSETETQILITVEMPGIAQDDIDVSINDNVLSISGEKQETRQSDEENRRVTERSFGRFERSMTLPFTCGPECVTAEYSNGVLNITVEKPAVKESKVRKVEIKTAA